MSEFLGSAPLTNKTLLCVGGITQREAERVREQGHETTGLGYYLFLADQSEPSKPIEVLAEFYSAGAAEKVARLLPSR
jgi:hypothetical protein